MVLIADASSGVPLLDWAEEDVTPVDGEPANVLPGTFFPVPPHAPKIASAKSAAMLMPTEHSRTFILDTLAPTGTREVEIAFRTGIIAKRYLEQN